MIDVRDLGAKGDRVTDDTAAIQAAVDAAVEQETTVLLPAGQYAIIPPPQLSPPMIKPCTSGGS